MSASPSASERLSHLLELAGQGPALRAALAEEVAELLIHWPDDCPQNMRGVVETLLAKCARDVDPPVRARLRVRLYADPDLAARVLPREVAGRALVEAARTGGDVEAALAEVLGLDDATAHDILGDGEKLALACKAAGIDRATFSALALTAGPIHQTSGGMALLERWNTIAVSEARECLHQWRAQAMACQPL